MKPVFINAEVFWCCKNSYDDLPTQRASSIHFIGSDGEQLILSSEKNRSIVLKKLVETTSFIRGTLVLHTYTLLHICKTHCITNILYAISQPLLHNRVQTNILWFGKHDTVFIFQNAVFPIPRESWYQNISFIFHILRN